MCRGMAEERSNRSQRFVSTEEQMIKFGQKKVTLQTMGKNTAKYM